MKYTFLLPILAIFNLWSCDDNDSVTPNPEAVKALETKYPQASRVEWETQNSYLVAEFIYNRQSVKAWFDRQGKWYLSETNLDSPDQLPEKVQQAIAESDYASWNVDNIDQLERSEAETVYVIEVKNNHQEFDLYYSSDGILIKAVPDDDCDDYENYLPGTAILSSEIKTFIATRYPESRIIESKMEHSRLEVEIIHENRGKEIWFQLTGEWISTHYDVFWNEVPVKVTESLTQSNYRDYCIDDIEYYETPRGNYYLFELEKGNTEVALSIDLEGNILQ